MFLFTFFLFFAMLVHFSLFESGPASCEASIIPRHGSKFVHPIYYFKFTHETALDHKDVGLKRFIISYRCEARNVFCWTLTKVKLRERKDAHFRRFVLWLNKLKGSWSCSARREGNSRRECPVASHRRERATHLERLCRACRTFNSQHDTMKH